MNIEEIKWINVKDKLPTEVENRVRNILVLVNEKNKIHYSNLGLGEIDPILKKVERKIMLASYCPCKGFIDILKERSHAPGDNRIISDVTHWAEIFEPELPLCH